MDWSYASLKGKFIRLPLRLVPAWAKRRIWFGPLSGYRWLADAGVNGYWLGFYEKPKVQLFYRNIRLGETVLDVGAHTGYYSLVAAQAAGPSGRVFAFEPLPRNLDFLRQHRKLNQVENLEIIPAAAGPKTGTENFAEGPDTTAGHIGQGPLTVDVVDLDSFAEKRNLRPGVLKIDVEGGGADVIRGAQRLLATFKPLIFFALHNAAERDAVRELVRQGYGLQILDGNSLDSSGEVLLRAQPGLG